MSKIKTRAFDVANYLRNEEDIAEYLRITLAEGDAIDLEEALDDIARARGMTHLYPCRTHESTQGFAALLEVIRSLGYQLAIVPSHSIASTSPRLA